jgi:Tol biopolymer transport system component/tRNA A-37 threonylcarbamoyl transferase component Bud32
MIRAAAIPLAVGASIGPYEILGWLGAGGMGDVYRARDARLARDVAIKVIPEALAADASRVRRFEQEARAAGQLNHPGILAVYDIGRHAAAPYIVSELLEGVSLRSRLKGGALPLRKVVDYGRQIAEGLAAAHDKNIVHRDVKPDNLFLTSDGRIKILDFGIAKLTRPGDETPQDAAVAAETEDGTVVGTAAYMSPEQVRGGAVDARSDLFSLGTILYEMLTGGSPFTRETDAETMTAILKADAPPLPPDVPPALARIVARCLEKTREMRFQSARDLAFALEVLSESGAAAVPRPASSAARALRARGALPWIAAAAIAIGLGSALAWNLTRPAPRLPVTRFALALPAGQLLNGNGGGHSLALSPDGARLAYVATRLYLRTMSEPEVKTMPGTERYPGVREPVFSPDGASIAFYALADQTLKRASVTGDTVTTICQADIPTGIAWGADGILFGQGRKGIMRVAANGGTPEVLVRVNDGETAQAPQMLPGAQHVLFTLTAGTARDRSDRAHIVVQSLQSGERKTLIDGGSDARYVPTGHLVYALSGSLYAVPFDLQRLEVTGAPLPIIDGVSRDTAAVTGAANYAFSNTGSLAYVRGPVTASALLDIGLMDRQGKVQPLRLPPGTYEWPRVSPDGKRLAVASDDDKEVTVWIYDLSGTRAIQRLTSAGNNRFPIWTSDSRRVAFQSDRDGDLGIFWQPADGGAAERLTMPATGESHAPESWSPKGDAFLFSITKGSDVSLWTFSLRDRKATPFGAVHSSNPTNAAFSPDGNWVAYASAERGIGTIYVQPFPATGIKYQLFAKGSDSPHHPRWSPDGRELFYDANPKVTGFEVVSVTTHPALAFGNAETVPKLFLMGGAPLRTPYDIAPDGRLVGRITAGQTEHVRSQADQIQMVLNWFEDLKARVPTR